jgi:hypothetical protein
VQAWTPHDRVLTASGDLDERVWMCRVLSETSALEGASAARDDQRVVISTATRLPNNNKLKTREIRLFIHRSTTQASPRYRRLRSKIHPRARFFKEARSFTARRCDALLRRLENAISLGRKRLGTLAPTGSALATFTMPQRQVLCRKWVVKRVILSVQ